MKKAERLIDLKSFEHVFRSSYTRFIFLYTYWLRRFFQFLVWRNKKKISGRI